MKNATHKMPLHQAWIGETNAFLFQRLFEFRFAPFFYINESYLSFKNCRQLTQRSTPIIFNTIGIVYRHSDTCCKVQLSFHYYMKKIPFYFFSSFPLQMHYIEKRYHIMVEQLLSCSWHENKHILCLKNAFV